VRDGPWNAVDAGLVQAAQTQASTLHDSSSAPSSGSSSSSTASKVVLLGQTHEQLGELAKRLGQPSYRGKQLADGLLKGARRIAGGPNVSQATQPLDLQQAAASLARTSCFGRPNIPGAANFCCNSAHLAPQTAL
jgi:hypothetical protein